MKNTRKKLHYLVLSIMAGTMIFLSSCKKESVTTSAIQDYPAEVTTDNWQEFIHAPKEVIDYHMQRAQEKAKLARNTGATKRTRCTGQLGNVKAYNGNSWKNMAGVLVNKGPYNALTDLSGNFCIPDDTPGPLCMSYNTSQTNGVDGTDLLLIQLHILGTQKFKTARQLLAADADENSQINVLDLLAIQNVILNGASFNNNLLFIPTDFYNLMQTQVDNTCTISSLFFDQFTDYSNCVGLSTVTYNRNVIKKGDVNGTFVF